MSISLLVFIQSIPSDKYVDLSEVSEAGEVHEPEQAELEGQHVVRLRVSTLHARDQLPGAEE